MKKMSIMFVAAMALAACGKKGPDCSKALANSMANAKSTMGQLDDKTKAKLIEIGVKHCEADKWSDDAVKCMVDSKTENEGKDCYGKLTEDQQKKNNDEAMAVMMPPAPPEAGSGSAAAPK